MSENPSWSLREVVAALVAIAFVLFVQGAVPFLMIPTLGQAVWTTGFSESLAHGPLLNLYVHDFGIPMPAAIAFGLAGAWPASLLIRLGLHAADAYATMAALWLGLAMFSAYRIARRFEASRLVALLGSIVWLTMPIIWAHAGYSMVSLGIALLSFYFLAVLKLFLIGSRTSQIAPSAVVLYFAAAIVSVFMDGYTFVMFAAGSSILLCYSLVTCPELRPALTMIAIPVHIASFGLAYVLFTAFIRKPGFEAQPIDFFRGWGLDLSFIVIPTKGVLWLPDLLGLSLKRTDELYFGDASVWVTTFALLVLLLGLVAWWRTRQMKIATGVLIVAIFGFYMALGPSLQIESTKPESLQLSHPGQKSALMPPEFAVMPTGNAWISEWLPGFNVMRAAYRWSAVGIFALWLLIMIQVPRTDRKGPWLLGLLAVVLFNLPNPLDTWREGVDRRDMFRQIDHDLVADLRQRIQPAETVAFIPARNDFFANYLAPSAGFRTFNIGGDKNWFAARSMWPPEMATLSGEVDPGKVPAAVGMLIDGAADVLVLPYFNMLWSAHLWPCPDRTTARLSDEQRGDLRSIPGFLCPAERKIELQPFITALRESPYVEVMDSDLFATVRLRPEFSSQANRLALLSSLFAGIHYPIVLETGFKESSYVLREGWHELESDHVWSREMARLTLPVPKDCETRGCNAVLSFIVFGASQSRSVPVSLSSGEPTWKWDERLVATSGDVMEVEVPLSGAKGGRKIMLSVPNATSPLALTGSPDGRVLGIGLLKIELKRQ